MEYFITEIDIKKVRHLENLTIKLSDTERKHLILTGKNGSGKTSVLEGITTVLSNWNVEFGIGSPYGKTSVNKILLKINTQKENLKEIVYNNEFLIVSFSPHHLLKATIPKNITKLEISNLNKHKPIGFDTGVSIIQYLVNLRFDKLNALDENDTKTVKKIDEWFVNFTKILQTIFQDNTLILQFENKEKNYYILTKDREKFDFTTLSDGYSAFLNIVTEIILRMESKAPKVYDIQGIVLIDEIETHLHIDLQKKIMPLLTTFFPKIQFIVTTHSPFVLGSISNAVIYDLEKHLRVEDLSSYAVDGIIEGYFDADKYSQEIKTKMARYEILAQKEQKTLEEREEFVDLRSELKDISAKLAPELAYNFKTLELSRLSKING